jgi:hypothetical protein
MAVARPTLLVLLLMIDLVACGDKPGDTAPVEGDTDSDVDSDTDTDTGPVDADGDGVPAWQDCDDEDAAVGGPSDWYADGDGDGFGDTDSARQACEPPPGHVAGDGDCDDGDPAVHPEAEEVCNGLDDDCDTLTDDADDSLDSDTQATWYIDADGDGWGTDSATIRACDQPSGYAGQDGDCDDGEAETNPESWDVIDGVDNDCDGLFDLVPTTRADVVIQGEMGGDTAGCSVAGARDVDGDGWTDLLVGACNKSTTHWNVGAAYLLYGPITSDLVLSGADAVVMGEEERLMLGSHVTLVGDLHGDGFDEAVIGAPQRDEWDLPGAVYLFEGPISGSLVASDADLTIDGGPSWAYGNLLDGGDINGDGLGDLLFGSTSGTSAASDIGRVVILDGASLATTGTVPLEELGHTISGEAGGDRFGGRVASAGDLDGDGLDDIAVTAYGADGAEAANTGCLYLFLSSQGWSHSASSASAMVWGSEGENIGNGLAAGADLDGDDILDIAVGAPDHVVSHSGDGAVYLVDGATRGTSTLEAAPVLLGGPGELVGMQLSLVGDRDGNGIAEIAAGYWGSAWTKQWPQIHVREFGAGAQTIDSEGIEFQAGAYDNTLGSSGRYVGDLSGDGVPDILVPASAEDSTFIDAGALYLFTTTP